MRKESKEKRRTNPLLLAILLVLLGFLSWILFSTPTLQSHLWRGWKTLTRESRRILGVEKAEDSTRGEADTGGSPSEKDGGGKCSAGLEILCP